MWGLLTFAKKSHRYEEKYQWMSLQQSFTTSSSSVAGESAYIGVKYLHQEELWVLWHRDGETGVFIWLVHFKFVKNSSDSWNSKRLAGYLSINLYGVFSQNDVSHWTWLLEHSGYCHSWTVYISSCQPDQWYFVFCFETMSLV